MQNTVARAQCQPDMRGRMESVPLSRNHANDVAAAQFGLDLGDLAFWNFIEWPRGNIRFHPRKRPEQRLIRSKIPIVPPANGHLARRMGDATSTEVPRHILHQS